MRCVVQQQLVFPPKGLACLLFCKSFVLPGILLCCQAAVAVCPIEWKPEFQNVKSFTRRDVKLPSPVVLGVDSRVKLVNAWIIWCDPHLSNVTTLSHILKGEANSTQYSKAICSKDEHVFGGPKRCVK